MAEKIMMPRLGGTLILRGYVMRCDCWRGRIPFLRRRHFARLVKEAGHER